MTQEAEFAQIVRQLPPESLKEIKKVLEALFDQQKAAEAKKYESLRITPFEAVKISRIGECDIALLAAFGLDCLRYNKANVNHLDMGSRVIYGIALLLEAGCIIGIRQERARRKK